MAALFRYPGAGLRLLSTRQCVRGYDPKHHEYDRETD
jgi:hypothetical protein